MTITKSAVGNNLVSIKGNFTGTGIFDAKKNILKITISGTTFSLNVARELDWEATPRQSTIVMAGFRTATQTYWMKKKSE